MEAFYSALIRYGYKGQKATTWIEAFNQLAELLESKKRKKRIVVFIDELPCFDTPRSGFIQTLDLFWNSRASWINNIYFVVCGSATSWMMRNIVNNKAGLHKRTTHTLHLRPFTLGQTEVYLKDKKFRWPKIAVMQIYMVLGGVPYYLSLLDPRKNVPDNIDTLFFSAEPELENEYQRLFKSLFKSADGIVTICEMKYSKDDYMLNEKEYRSIIRRVETFQKETGHRGGIQVSLVTTYGLHENMYPEISPTPITMNELFE